jgi:pimeloyl-ACP methyl ester carboxylesterase
MHGNRTLQYPFRGSVPQYHDWGKFMFNLFTLKPRKFIAAAATAAALLSAVDAAPAEPVKNIVLVHGAFADGSGWRRVADILGKDGYAVSVVQEPLTSLADDVAATKRVLELQQGPTLLVGHSYGGVVITEAGNAPNVVGLVYIAAFIPDKGESALGLLSQAPAANADTRATKDDFLYLDPAAFPADFAADVPPIEANFMAHSQAMLAKTGGVAPVTSAAWHQKKSWALIASHDHNINPNLERSMAKRAGSETIEVPASHAVYISRPDDVARFIERAAKAPTL